MSAKFTRCCRTLLAPCLALLWSCSTAPGATFTAVDPPPANLTAPCQPPSRLATARPLLLGDLVEADAELAADYLECLKRYDGLRDWAQGVTRRQKDKNP